MKKAIVIGTFPTDKTTEKMLISCIESAKAFEWDVILVSHKPLSPDIISMVDYYIYDKKNILEPHEFTPVYWYSSDTFHLSINGRGHIVPVCRNIVKGIGLASVLDYQQFVYMESDNILSWIDVDILKSYLLTMSYDDKDMILFDLNDGRYESLLFAGNPSFFMRHQNLPLETGDMFEKSCRLTLEEIFYDNFSKLKAHILLMNGSSESFFKNSQINLIANHHKVEIVKVENSDHYILWASNSPDNPDPIEVIVNDFSIDIQPNGYYYRQVVPGEVYDVRAIENNRTYRKKLFTTQKDLKEYDNNGYIRFT